MALDAGEKTPFGPWHDYSRQLGGAEDAVGNVIESVLMDGGTILWQKYLERKAFSFAAGAVTEAVVSKLKMCFVAHDKGEDITIDEEWEMEDEPESGEIDSWARMHLPVRRLVRGEDSSASMGTAKQVKARQKLRSVMDIKSRQSLKMPPKVEKIEPRAAPIQEELVLDEEEERLRDQKCQEEARRKDKERKAKEAEKAKDEERKTVIALHEEMARKAHTFDSEGKILWVEEIKTDKLPKVTETFGYNIKKEDTRQPRTESSSTVRNAAGEGKAENPAAGARSNRRPQRQSRGTRKSKVDDGELEFTDGFSKLQHGQPPILDTMNVQAGVVLESMGKKKAGADVSGGSHRQMSRKEYVMLAQQDAALGEFRTDGASGSKQTPDGENSAEAPGKAEAAGDPGRGQAHADRGPPASAAPAQEGMTTPSGSAGLLPPVQQAGGQRGAPGGQRAGGNAGQQGAGSKAASTALPSSPQQPPGAPVQRAPPAPPMTTRSRRFEAVGNLGRPPRYHMPLLGGPSGMGAPQPPLGATMGHGLIRHGSLKETYFFPAQKPDLTASMFRSSSDVSLLSTRRGEQASINSTKKGRSSKPASREASQQSAEKGLQSGILPEQEEEELRSGGRMRSEANLAYRAFRAAVTAGGRDGSAV